MLYTTMIRMNVCLLFTIVTIDLTVLEISIVDVYRRLVETQL